MPIPYDDKFIVRPGREIQYTQEMIKELTLCAKDIIYFAEKYVTIIHPIKGEMVIKLYPFQKEMIKAMAENRFSIFCCGRQLGKSTCACIYLLWYALFNPTKTVAILANKQSTAASLIGDIKKAYSMLPAWMKPGVVKFDQLEIGFENDSRIFARATSADALRGESVSLMLADEFAFVPQEIAEDFWVSNFPTLSTGGSVVVVSTPNGTAGKFYQLWMNAVTNKDSKWKHMKVSWEAHPDRDEAWKEAQLQALSKVKFAQEHAVSFTGSAYTLVDGDLLSKIKAIEPPFYLEEGLHTWKKPVPNRIYMVTCDVAKGSNNDYHVANIWDVTEWHTIGKIEQVAMFRRNDISVFDFKDKIKQLSEKYNMAMAVIENNNLGSVITNQLYFEDGYENVWYDVDKGEYGINANAKTKPLALSYFKEDVESGKMLIRSQDMLNELSYFEEVRTGIFQARTGRGFFDDTVVSGYWTSYALRSRFWEDHLHFLTKNTVQILQNNDAEQNDEEAMQNFMRNFGGSRRDTDEDLESFRRGLSQG